MRLSPAANRAGIRLPTINAVNTKPALDSIIRVDCASSSEITNPRRSSAIMQRVVLTTRTFPFVVILRLSGHRIQKSGKARYVRPIRVPASNPAAKAPISEAVPNATNAASESRSIPIKG